MTSNTQVPLSERIAALQGKVVSPPARAPSPGGALVPGSAESTLSRAGTLRDKIARFEQKGGVPIPRGSFGLGAPPSHTNVPQRKGELWGNRLPELGKGGSFVTPSHSRRGSFADGAEFSDDGRSPSSRSPSPAFGLRQRTVSSTSASSLNSASASSRRTTMHFPGELSDKVRAMQRASSIPAFAETIDFAALQQQEPVPPLPPMPNDLMPAAVISEKDNSRDASTDDGHGDHTDTEESQQDGGASATSDELTDAETPSEPKAHKPPFIAVPAIQVEEVKTPLPPPEADTRSPQSPTPEATSPEESPDSVQHVNLPSAVQSPLSAALDSFNDELPTPSTVLTPSTMAAFPVPPTHVSKPNRDVVAAVAVDDDEDLPPPPPPKDDHFVHGRSTSTASKQTLAGEQPLYQYSSNTQYSASQSSHVRADTSSEHSTAPPMTPPPIQQLAPSPPSTSRSNTVRKPLVVPNWWEDDEDQEVDGGYVKVTAVIKTR
ncbi:hypothetical protein AURDEDRAFT_110913 [Auricularia subglabra TFB-10046 SS5]|nr:hypothetical protein AURDEDRAFT_110913 [Auricularia subglabra TFB-10046 SS5]